MLLESTTVHLLNATEVQNKYITIDTSNVVFYTYLASFQTQITEVYLLILTHQLSLP